MLHLLLTGRVGVKEMGAVHEKDMEKEIIFVVEEAPEGGYIAKALGHCICTEADSFARLKKRVQEATRCHFEAEEMPAVIRLRVVKDEVIPA
jgi:hypothetical protein